MRGLVRGFAAPFRGAGFIARHRLWGYLVVPVALNLVVVAGALLVATRMVRRKMGDEVFVSSPAVSWLVLAFLAGLLGVVLFIIAQPVVSAPFVDRLSERVEEIARGHAPRVGLAKAVAQSLLHGLGKLVLYALAALVGVALGAVTGLGAAFGVALGAVFLAFDAFDYPLARRGIGFWGKWGYLALHPAQTLGYCVGASLLYLVPLGLLVAPCCAAAGATLAYLDTAPAPSAPGPDAAPAPAHPPAEGAP
jgi:CysZ protein